MGIRAVETPDRFRRAPSICSPLIGPWLRNCSCNSVAIGADLGDTGQLRTDFGEGDCQYVTVIQPVYPVATTTGGLATFPTHLTLNLPHASWLGNYFYNQPMAASFPIKHRGTTSDRRRFVLLRSIEVRCLQQTSCRHPSDRPRRTSRSSTRKVQFCSKNVPAWVQDSPIPGRSSGRGERTTSLCRRTTPYACELWTGQRRLGLRSVIRGRTAFSSNDRRKSRSGKRQCGYWNRSFLVRNKDVWPTAECADTMNSVEVDQNGK